jgi:hypothetical protein
VARHQNRMFLFYRRIARHRLRRLSVARKHPAPTWSLAKSAHSLHRLTGNRNRLLDDAAGLAELMVRSKEKRHQSSRKKEEPSVRRDRRAHDATLVAPPSKLTGLQFRSIEPRKRKLVSCPAKVSA